MDNEQFTLIFNAICFFISVAGAIVSGFFCFRTLKDSWEEKKKEKEKSASYRRIGTGTTSSTPLIRSSRFDGNGLPEAPSMKMRSDSPGRNTC